ncbi:DUF6415 family natural product biosynthesis protein [Streptomyces sp. NPDC017993]|uniref:DUF6415 family natural product biosynthesis protein n=1 Tax=Streptomyces sp. NPDC017993 TaxID=3365027 RepID=UPI0037BA6727
MDRPPATTLDLAQQVPVNVARETLPIDVVTIDETISRALRVNVGRLDLVQLGELEEELRGHIGLLLPEARDAAGRIWRGSPEWHRRIVRLDGIERQVKQGISDAPLASHFQVQQLARDCQWLLDDHKEREQTR